MTKEILTAEVEWVTRSIVRVDIEKFVAYYPDERREFVGSDVDFVKASFQEFSLKELLEPTSDVGDGIEIEGEWDEGEISYYGVGR